MLPERREIYKNLRWPEGHELPGFIAVILVLRKCVLPCDLYIRLAAFVSREVASGLVGQQDPQVAKVISGGSGDYGVA